ncbi:spermine/spermidine synthase domain-containing protein [Tuwongella immobilis]|uniref:PABS domain-containing protein n=1 Tax=Tuwongella immobilis TaxID=692036 RepID=A0A6C2YJ15_9BACT|nr:hypothetical protein [Tuwongella immobilis]VIP01397.1 Uncultured bacterium genome assembly Metasoil_fosmids_resub OS=uncultured bacterium PE=4 SV=1: Spermine_synth [Tuwongella immobilis]VTR98284.1 Uncultured bacterium genome assembly Metasoil_fosmids_resub OS=uncultured bacterium PE=4 SV=1: Spermine_synth [Tuwongella immobilis]
MSETSVSTAQLGRGHLFGISMLILFLELACIRWFPSHVLFLTFFTNMILLACFLGMSLGCLMARGNPQWIRLSPWLLILAMGLGMFADVTDSVINEYVDVGRNSESPQMVFFGTETAGKAEFNNKIPIEVIGLVFFLLITGSMIGPGMILGRCLMAVPGRVEAYTIDIAGSLTGILLFSTLSWFSVPAWVWFLLIALALVKFMDLLEPAMRPEWPLRLFMVIILPVLALSPLRPILFDKLVQIEMWSPYYRILYTPNVYDLPIRDISTNLIGHQRIHPRNETPVAYPLPHLLNRDAGLPKFKSILIIGAGSGNDVSRALQFAAPDAHIDAVDIEPVIQSIGVRENPDQPYADPRVHVQINDGRNFLKSTTRKYDFVLFALVDSLVLHSGYSNIRLESYLFTQESIADVKRCLADDGLFVMSNYFRQGFIIHRLDQTLASVFGEQRFVMTMPPVKELDATGVADGFGMFFSGPRTEPIRAKLNQHGGNFWVPTKKGIIRDALALPNGYRDAPPPEEAGVNWIGFHPTPIINPTPPILATDDWPFLYLREPMVPDLSIRTMIMIGSVSLVLLYLTGLRTHGQGGTTLIARMFFLGAAFMLLETKAVVHMSLLYGSTWIVNSVVFAGILVMILLSNLWVIARRPQVLTVYYVLLIASLVLNALVPLDAFLGMSSMLQLILPTGMVALPVFFAGVIFATSFSRSTDADRSFGFNIAGAILGGLVEYFSMLIGFRYLVLLAAGLYLLSSLQSGTNAASSESAAPASPPGA